MNHRRLLIGTLIVLAASSCKGKGTDGAAPDPSGSAENESDIVVAVPEPPPPQDEVQPPAPSAASVWYHGFWNLDAETKTYVWQAGYWQDPEPAAAPPNPPPAPRVETVGPPPWPGYGWNGGYWRWSSTREYVWLPGHWTLSNDVRIPPPPPPRWEQVSGHWIVRDDARVMREETWTHWQAQRDVIRERETRAIAAHPVYNHVYVHTEIARPEIGRPEAPGRPGEPRPAVAEPGRELPRPEAPNDHGLQVAPVAVDAPHAVPAPHGDPHTGAGTPPTPGAPASPGGAPTGHGSGPSSPHGGGDHGTKKQ